ncbi:MAG: dTDP-glucose 4,6-dehydratase [Parashewanella sp.]
MKVLVTGGSGFIGSALIRFLLSIDGIAVLNIDKLTYASQLNALSSVEENKQYQFQEVDICDSALLSSVLNEFQPTVIFHLAAESHVDRSISGPEVFIQSNVVGTFSILEAARSIYDSLKGERKNQFRFIHVSTDEVYGDLPFPNEEGGCLKFTEQSNYQPNSPYSASKASSDHLVRAWHRTYGLPCLITHCSNNYGPYQHSEKLIPRMIYCALTNQPLPVYGEGRQVRDWLHVEDHVSALFCVMKKGIVGQTYNIGGDHELSNLQLVQQLCDTLEQVKPARGQYRQLITFVEDRLGHDRRYAIDNRKIQQQLNWQPKYSFDDGLRQTVQWYLTNPQWCQ